MSATGDTRLLGISPELQITGFGVRLGRWDKKTAQLARRTHIVGVEEAGPGRDGLSGAISGRLGRAGMPKGNPPKRVQRVTQASRAVASVGRTGCKGALVRKLLSVAGGTGHTHSIQTPYARAHTHTTKSAKPVAEQLGGSPPTCHSLFAVRVLFVLLSCPGPWVEINLICPGSYQSQKQYGDSLPTPNHDSGRILSSAARSTMIPGTTFSLAPSPCQLPPHHGHH